MEENFIWSSGTHTCSFGNCKIVFHNHDIYPDGEMFRIVNLFHTKYSNICRIIVDIKPNSTLYRLQITSGNAGFARAVNTFFKQCDFINPVHPEGELLKNDFNYVLSGADISTFFKKLYNNFAKQNGNLKN